MLKALLALGLICGTLAQSLRQQSCSDSRTATIQPGAKAVIGGLFEISRKGADGNGCGVPGSSMQHYEAIRWALERLNKKDVELNGEQLTDTYVPGITLGMVATDYCQQSEIAVSGAQSLYNRLNLEASACKETSSSNLQNIALGMIGAWSSGVTENVGNFLEKFQIPLVSFSATSPSLSDRAKHPNFMRTVPPDGLVMKVLTQLMNKMNWKFVTIVYTTDTFGKNSYKTLEPLLIENGICLTAAVAVDGADTSDNAMDSVLKNVVQTGSTGVVYLGAQDVAMGLLKRGMNVSGAGKLQWMFTDAIPVSHIFKNNPYPRGIISVMSGGRKIVEFEDHWIRIDENNPSSENPWFKDWYMEMNDCKLAGVTYQPYASKPDCAIRSETYKRTTFVQDQFVEPAVHAVYAYAKALKQAQKDKCGNVPGVCQALLIMDSQEFQDDYLSKVNFTYTKEERIESMASAIYEPYLKRATLSFDKNGDIISPIYDIWNYNDETLQQNYKFRRVGTFSNDELSISMVRIQMFDEGRTNILPNRPSSLCPAIGCKPCIGLPTDLKYYYKPGDIIIEGLFSVHNHGDNPLIRCGDFDKHMLSGIQYMEGMMWAIDQINNDNNILNGIKLGGLAFDDCWSRLRGSSIISSVQRQLVEVKDPNGQVLDVRKIKAFEAAHTSGLSLNIANLMNRVKKPVVSYGGSSSELVNEERYPYYLRTISGVGQQALAMVMALKRLGWNYVQSVNGDGAYGRNLAMKFREIAAQHGVCVVASHEMSMTGKNTPEEAVKNLALKPSVKVVIVHGQEADSTALLNALKNTNMTGQYQLFGGIAWGNSAKVVEGYKAEAEGSLSLMIKKSAAIGPFEDYIKSLRVSTYTQNPWFKEWYETFHECYINPDMKGDYPKQCFYLDSTAITDAPGFQFNDYASHAIYALYAIAKGIHKTLEDKCGVNYIGVCGNFANNADIGLDLVENIKKVEIVDSNDFTFAFNNRDPNWGFTYLNYLSIGNGSYQEVGSFEIQTADFELKMNDIVLRDGIRVDSYAPPTCPGMCIDCLYMFSYQKYMHIPGDLYLSSIVDIHRAGSTPFSCGDLRFVNGFQYTEGIAFALNALKRGNLGVSLNIDLGALVFDGCSDDVRAEMLVSAIHSGIYQDYKKSTFELSKLQGWLTYDSDSTIKVADMLKLLGVPVVTPAATSMILNDKDRFTTLFRTIPSDEIVAKAMASTAKELGMEYIITLNEPTFGSREARDAFRKYAKEMGICIAASYEFVTDGDIELLLGYIVKSDTRVVAVFSEPNMHVSNLLEAKNSDADYAEIVFLGNRPWEATYYKPNARDRDASNSLIFRSSPGSIREFEEFLRTEAIPEYGHRNPWLQEYYETKFQCNLYGNWKYNEKCTGAGKIVDDPFINDVFVMSTINAVAALADGVHRTLQSRCGNTYTTVCNEFYSSGDAYAEIMNHMDKNTDFTDLQQLTFKFVQREVERGIKVMKLQWDNLNTLNLKESEEGSYTAGSLTLTSLTAGSLKANYMNTKKTCVTSCGACLRESDINIDFAYTPGEIMFVGLFDIHKKGPTPYTCGEINMKHGLQLQEAFHFAIEYVNANKGIFADKLRGVTIGGISFDICQSATRTGNLVANLHNDKLSLNKNGITVRPEQFDVYIGTLETESTIRAADITNILGIPQVTYGATSLELRDARKYQYLLRTVPADDKQSRAIISFLKKFDLKNVQVVNSFHSVGIHGLEEFYRLALLNKICVSQNITLGEDGEITQDDISEMMTKLPKSNGTVIVLFMRDPSPVFKYLSNNVQKLRDYFFIGTDKWGADLEVIGHFGDALKLGLHAVTFDVENADIPEFDEYLEDKTPANHINNPWFTEYYEKIYDCKYSSNSSFPNTCAKKFGISRADEYLQDPYVLYVINSVFASALGVHEAIKQECGDNYYRLCNLLMGSHERRSIIHRNIKKSKFTDQTQQPFYFTETGESDRGYHIYKPQSTKINDQGYKFYDAQVGSYNETFFLKIDHLYEREFSWLSPCHSTDCQCKFPEYVPSRYMLNESPFDLNIVYISDIHKQAPKNRYACGDIDTSGNFQNLLAFFFAINQVNQNAGNLFPASLRLGGLAMDSCSAPYRIGQDLYSLLSGEGLCQVPGGEQVISPSTIVSFIAKDSPNAITASSVLSAINITTLSQSATAVELGNKLYHSHFLRTVPPDSIQSTVMIEILRRFGWNYASIVYTDNIYGLTATKALLDEAKTSTVNPICIGRAISMPMNATLTDAMNIVEELSLQVGARVVIVYVLPDHARLLLQATQEKGLSHQFVWIASEAWADNMFIVNGVEEAATGAITIQIQSKLVEQFKNFILGLSMKNKMGIPNDWFDEFYQTVHKCRILGSSIEKNFPVVCTGEEEMKEEMVQQDPFVFHTILSVYAIANGLSDLCRNPGLTVAACLHQMGADRKNRIYGALQGSQFGYALDDVNFQFGFTKDGHGDIGYNILNFRRNPSSGEYEYGVIGTYEQKSLSLQRSDYYGPRYGNSQIYPVSRCPASTTCSCKDKNFNNYDLTTAGSSSQYYIITANGSYIDPSTGKQVLLNNKKYPTDRFRDIWAIIVASIAAIGCIVSICMFIYLLVVYPVRTGTTILGYILCFGIILLYALVFAFIAHPTIEICGLRRFALGFVYALCYGALLIKIIDNWRVRKYEEMSLVKYNKIGQPLGLFFLVCLLVIVQVIICCEWMILEPPGVIAIVYNDQLWPRCTDHETYDEALVMSNIFVMALIVLCVFFGLWTWKNSKNHHESRWILGIAMLTIPCWVLWCLVSIIGEYKIRDAAVCIGLLYNATVMLLLGPLRKLFLLGKYQEKIAEEERKEQYAEQNGGYSSVYARQYDNAPRLRESEHGSVKGASEYRTEEQSFRP